MTRQYNNTPTILCIYVLLVSSVGVSRHRLDTHWTVHACTTVAENSFHLHHCASPRIISHEDSGIRIPEICFMYDSGFRNPASVIGNSGIRITERNFIKKYKKIPRISVLVLVCSRWQIYTEGGNVENVINARAKCQLSGTKQKEIR